MLNSGSNERHSEWGGPLDLRLYQGGSGSFFVGRDTVDGSEIPNNHRGCMNPWWSNGINYQPQLVSRISEPSTVGWLGFASFNHHLLIFQSPWKSLATIFSPVGNSEFHHYFGRGKNHHPKAIVVDFQGSNRGCHWLTQDMNPWVFW